MILCTLSFWKTLITADTAWFIKKCSTCWDRVYLTAEGLWEKLLLTVAQILSRCQVLFQRIYHPVFFQSRDKLSVLFWTNINGLGNLILNFSITSSVGPDLSPQTLSCASCNAYIMQKTVQICQVVPICRVLVDSNPVFFFLPQYNASTNFNILEKHLWQGSDRADDQRETLRLETGGMRETVRAAAKSYSGSNILFYLCGHQLDMIFLLGNPSAPCRMESKCSEVWWAITAGQALQHERWASQES